MLFRKIRRLIVLSEIIFWAIILRVADWVGGIAEAISDTADAKLDKNMKKMQAQYD